MFKLQDQISGSYKRDLCIINLKLFLAMVNQIKIKSALSDSLISKTIRRFRYGCHVPVANLPGHLGVYFIRYLMDLIQTFLDPSEQIKFLEVRNYCRTGVDAANSGFFDLSNYFFKAANDFVSSTKSSEQCTLVCLSAIDAARAYLEYQQGDWNNARNSILKAMKNDHYLEEKHNFEILHMQRIHLCHLYICIEAASGNVEKAIEMAHHSIQYLTEGKGKMPIGEGWNFGRLFQLPEDLKTIAISRISGEIGIILASYEEAKARQLFEKFDFQKIKSNKPIVMEIQAWEQAKKQLLHNRVEDFVEQSSSFLLLGRRKTILWYTLVLDLCSAFKQVAPVDSKDFLLEVQQWTKTWLDIPKKLLPILDNLIEKPDNNFLSKNQLSDSPRKFHTFILSLPRTGTSSMASLFHEHHRSYTEFMEKEAMEAILAWDAGILSDVLLRDFILFRDQRGQLEMDSASFHHYYMDILLKDFPDAKYILTIRECYSWINSYLNLLMRWNLKFKAEKKTPPTWMAEYGKLCFGDFEWHYVDSPETIIAKVPDLLDGLLNYWIRTHRAIFEKIPNEKLLVIRTEQISHKLHDLANFIGVPFETLSHQHHHVNGDPEQVDLLQNYTKEAFYSKCWAIGGDVMERYFPELNPSLIEKNI